MPDHLTQLLDQIDRLDQEATKGPWDHTVEWAEIGSGSDSVIHGYYDGQCPACAEKINDAASVAISLEDLELIVLARTALPKLAEAVYHVLDLLDVVEKSDKYSYEFGGSKSPSLVTTNEVRRAITDAMEGGDE